MTKKAYGIEFIWTYSSRIRVHMAQAREAWRQVARTGSQEITYSIAKRKQNKLEVGKAMNSQSKPSVMYFLQQS